MREANLPSRLVQPSAAVARTKKAVALATGGMRAASDVPMLQGTKQPLVQRSMVSQTSTAAEGMNNN
jgi:hypothetical protein